MPFTVSQGMRVSPEGPNLISTHITDSLNLDCSVLMGANIAEVGRTSSSACRHLASAMSEAFQGQSLSQSHWKLQSTMRQIPVSIPKRPNCCADSFLPYESPLYNKTYWLEKSSRTLQDISIASYMRSA